jgi:hypothetical protein
MMETLKEILFVAAVVLGPLLPRTERPHSPTRSQPGSLTHASNSADAVRKRPCNLQRTKGFP